ncbi:MAG: hypothetical protein QM715_02385 [Nibricoccus sp.]
MKISLLFLSLCVVAAWIPAWSRSSYEDGASAEAFPGWNAAPVPSDMTPLTPGEREARFAAGFPGKIGVFTDGERTYVLRWVCSPTRKLHPAADCLRALGYGVKPTPIFAEANGARWGTSRAQRGQEELRVRERIVDSAGNAWTDVSAWYWSATLGRSAGPWWAVTIFERPNHGRKNEPFYRS